MAKGASLNQFFSIGGTDLSGWVRRITLNVGYRTVDITSMSDLVEIFAKGLEFWTLEVEFNQDFAAGGPDATIQPLVGTTSTFIAREDAGTVSPTNPNYTATAFVAEWPPFGAAVGDARTATASFASAGSMSRATS